jgi:hypothetical protein
MAATPKDWSLADEVLFNEMQKRRTAVLADRRLALQEAVKKGFGFYADVETVDGLIANAGPICDALAVYRTDLPEAAR